MNGGPGEEEDDRMCQYEWTGTVWVEIFNGCGVMEHCSGAGAGNGAFIGQTKETACVEG